MIPSASQLTAVNASQVPSGIQRLNDRKNRGTPGNPAETTRDPRRTLGYPRGTPAQVTRSLNSTRLRLRIKLSMLIFTSKKSITKHILRKWPKPKHFWISDDRKRRRDYKKNSKKLSLWPTHRPETTRYHPRADRVGKRVAL